MSWQASSDTGAGVSGYRVFRDGSSAAAGTVVSTSFTDSGLQPETTYSYAVRAFDGANPANESALSASTNAETLNSPDPDSGLDGRPDNTSCVAGDRPSQDVVLATERVFTSLPVFENPVLMLQAPQDDSRWFVVEQRGIVKAFDNSPDVAASNVFIDITSRVQSGGEQGLLGMAFHPDFPADSRAYLSYTNASNGLVSRVSEFRSRDGGRSLDPSSEVVVLSADQPASNHNGGHIAFGPDGYLYVGLGDGGGAGDSWGDSGNGQNLQTTLGKLLRIDIDGSTGPVPYAIPAGNSYAGNALCSSGTGASECPEIYAYGLRNPWRWSFDRDNGELWLADVGQNAWEEVNRIVPGGNYGWRCFEGANPFNANCGPNAASSIAPIAQYAREFGRSATGGYVYRGADIPALAGRYVLADFVSGTIWHIASDTPPTLTLTSGFASGLSIASFAENQVGELFVVNYSGSLHRLVEGVAAGGSVATSLSETGCVLADDPAQPAAGLVPYEPNAPFWSDGAAKDRYLALPNGTSMSIGADGDFEFPNGTVLMKNFRLGGDLVETRLFMRHTDGEWAGYSYQWNGQGTDARRVVGGKTASVDGQTWVFPSEAQCLACHTAAAGRSLSLEIAQLNGDLFYSATGRTANQIATLNAIGMIFPKLATEPAGLPALPDPYGSAGTLEARARAYLHSNCAQCHRPNGGTPTDLDLRSTTQLAEMNACDRSPQAGHIGIRDALIIAAGDADRSVLIARMNRRSGPAMPPLASTVVDERGVSLVSDWVNSLTGCD